MDQNFYKIIIIAALILFSIFRRVRRNIGWQQLNLGRLRVRTAIFFVIGLAFLVAGASHPINLISDVVGILIGIILAYYSGGLTSFERRDGRWFYRQNNWIGSIVIAIFFGRFIYRIYEIYTLGEIAGLPGGQTGGLQNMGNAIGNSWTAGLMLIMFAYYIGYYIYLLRNQKHLSHSEKKISD